MILKNEDCDDDGNIRAVQILHDIHYFAYILIFLNNSDLVHNWSNFSSKTKSYKCDFLLDFFIQWRRVIWAAPMLARLIKKFFRKSRLSNCEQLFLVFFLQLFPSNCEQLFLVLWRLCQHPLYTVTPAILSPKNQPLSSKCWCCISSRQKLLCKSVLSYIFLFSIFAKEQEKYFPRNNILCLCIDPWLKTSDYANAGQLAEN